MKKSARIVHQAQLAARIQRLTRELEELVEEIEEARGDDDARFLLAEPSRSLARAVSALRAAVQEGRPDRRPGSIRDVLEGTSPLMSLLGSRIVLSQVGREAPRPPSAGAQALAALLEDPARTFDAAQIAERLGCSVPIARTTLNRLVKSSHATRLAAGRFRARAR
jgi:hypothetical protein